MTEKHLFLEEIDPQIFYGAQNSNLKMVKSLFPKIRITARGDMMQVIGNEDELDDFEKFLRKVLHHCATYNQLTSEDIVGLLRGELTTSEVADQGNVIFSTSGKPIRPRNEHQQQLCSAFAENDLIFACGPAGTGKTYLSIALAVSAFKRKQIRKIILSRPAVEAGEKLGFLPGDMKEKIDPYLQPLYDALGEMIPPLRLQELLSQNIIEIAPLAFMRGRTLNDAVVILDEAQNATSGQLKMFLTRMGNNTKMLVTGDCSQVDLPASQRSGLCEALTLLKGIEGIRFINFDKRDIVRHKLVTRIVEAYEHANKTTIQIQK